MSDQNVAPDAQQPAAPAEVAAPPAPPAAPVAPAPTPDAPWAADLASAFQDEAERARVDQFMREKYQPYVTRIEQESAPARQIYDALQGEDSLETYLGLAEQLYGEDVANLLAETIVSRYSEAEAPAAPAAEAPAAPTDITQLPPEVQEELRANREMREQWEADQAKNHYWQEMARVKQADARVDEDLFHPFVVGAGGDFDQALAQYQAWHAKAYPAAPAGEAPAPPATLGTDGVGGPEVPTEKRYDSLDSAMDDFLSDVRANRNPPPTTVGSA